MKFSKSWVMEWVRTELSDNALAEQITFLQIEQWFVVDSRMQQTAVDQVQSFGGQFAAEVVGVPVLDGRAAGCQPVEQLARNALQMADQTIGIGRLLSE